ncbi:MAG: hypothetical protein LBV33_05205, partial [Lachnospiraceae bacterium]|nr:hypothetical protein [Lachnospiraceae bacterium]
FSDDPESIKKILMISDGEIDMITDDETEAAITRFGQAVSRLKQRGIAVDIVALGGLPEDEQNLEMPNIYRAAGDTGGEIYNIEITDGLSAFANTYLLEECRIPAIVIGRIGGGTAELKVELPDAFMDTAKIMLVGGRSEIAVDVSGRSERMLLAQGKGFAIVKLEKPQQENFDLQIMAQPTNEAQALSDQETEIIAYLTAEYSLSMTAGNRYQPKEGEWSETGTAYFDIDIVNDNGDSVLAGHLRDQRITILVDGKEQQSVASAGQLQVSKEIVTSTEVSIGAILPPSYASYYGVLATTDYVVVPPPPEPPEIDYFLISIILLLLCSLLVVLVWSRKRRGHYPGYLVKRKSSSSGVGALIQNSDSSVGDSAESGHSDATAIVGANGLGGVNGLGGGKDIGGDSSSHGIKGFFGLWGRLTVYVVNSADGIDYNPESVNLNTKCSKETISLQWVLDACNLPIILKDADKIIFRPGEGKSLLVKNTGKATALKGRDVMSKFHNYPFYFHEKITFIFDNDLSSTIGGLAPEIELHYNDLRITER